jgi:hypothetical protein
MIDKRRGSGCLNDLLPNDLWLKGQVSAAFPDS